MIYLTDNDLKRESFERFITDSTADFNEAKDSCELVAIGIVKTLLKGRYDVDIIFDEADPVRDEFLADIITKITIHKIFGRNAARKVPSDIKENYDAAMKSLKEINGGKVILDLPVNTDEDGNPTAKPMFGNNTNEDFYI